ncbi:NACHT domain-containing protein [Williamwhitmania taraxaci]|uniref:NACHT domain-containing protein n=2 Tax=Williamwhitmania taraxaci TaxID=1640674 RepID=A0A1G6GQH5_9BACT|nr:NACHT domain-containing protein [Williamwhitmania taraxaci]
MVIFFHSAFSQITAIFDGNNINQNFMIDRLKTKTEVVFGKTIKTQKDCTTLSLRVLEATGEVISHSTIRRCWGLLKANTKPSLYTLDVLSRYCGLKTWAEFVKLNTEKSPIEDNNKQWTTSLKRCLDETKETIDYIRRRCGIQYELAADRLLATDRLDVFLRSTYTATAIIGPGGYGKSTLLAKWVEKQIAKNAEEDSIILFIRGNKLENSIGAGSQLKNWINYRITGDSMVDISDLVAHNKNSKRSILIIIDGLDEINLPENRCTILADQLSEFVSSYSATGLKLIVSSRNSTWEKYYIPQLQHEQTSNKEWLGSWTSNNGKSLTNIPPLSRMEIQEILNHTINGGKTKKILVDDLEINLRQAISYPYYLQLFISTGGYSDTELSIGTLDLMDMFLKSQIYNSPLADEKLDILNAILESQEYGILKNTTYKTEIKKRYPIHLKTAGKYFDAYHDLISFGIITEEIVESKYKTLNTAIRIANENLRSALIVRHLIETNKGIDFPLFQNIDNTYSEGETKVMIIANLFHEAYLTRNAIALIPFFSLKQETIRSVIEQGQVGISLRKDQFMRNKLIPEYAKNTIAQDLLFENFVDIDYLTISYSHWLKEYLKHKKDKESEIFAYSLLALSSLYQLDRPRSDYYINEIKKISPSLKMKPTTIARWLSVQILHSYLTAGTIDSELITAVQRFQKELNKAKGTKHSTIHGEFETIISTALLFCKEYEFASKVLSAGEKKEFQYDKNIISGITPEYAVLKVFADYGKKESVEISKIISIENNLDSINGTDSLSTKALAYSLVGGFYFHQNKTQKFNNYFQTALELVTFCQNKYLEVKLLKQLSSLLRQLDETGSADQCEIYAKGMAENSGFIYSKF